MGASHDVDGELARMKAELGQGSAPRQLGPAGSADGQAAPAPAQAARPAEAGDGE
jgi:phage shock protein A